MKFVQKGEGGEKEEREIHINDKITEPMGVRCICQNLQPMLVSDLAVLFMIQGRASMCGTRCLVCDQVSKAWSNVCNQVGEMITDEMMSEALENTENHLGITKKPVWKFLIEEYIIPILHLEIGLGNYQVHKLIRFLIDIDSASEEEQQKRVRRLNVRQEINEADMTYQSMKIEKEEKTKELAKDR